MPADWDKHPSEKPLMGTNPEPTFGLGNLI